MQIILNTFYALTGLLLLYYGAEFLVKGGVKIAGKLKVPPLVIGLTLVAFATSAPEMVVSIEAAINGLGDISIGNVVGSNICNIALILGVCAMITPLTVNRKLFKVDVPLMIISAFVLTVFCVLSKGLVRWQGALFFAGIVFYTVFSIISSRKEEKAQGNPDEKPQIQLSSGGLIIAIIFVAGGLAALIGGAKLFVNSAVYFARLCKISNAVIGLTVVAVGTSLPELATSVVAAIKGEKDIAIGNVVGSNIFNILAICGVAPLISPITAEGINIVDMSVMTAVSLLLYPLMRSGFVISRKEGILLFLIYAGYTAWLLK